MSIDWIPFRAYRCLYDLVSRLGIRSENEHERVFKGRLAAGTKRKEDTCHSESSELTVPESH